MRIRGIYVSTAFLLVSFAAQAGDEGAAGTTTGRICYVSPSGEDTAPGTREKPKRSIRLAGQSLAPGDTLVLLKGEFDLKEDDAVFKKLSGTKERPITFRGEKGAVLRGGYVAGASREDPRWKNKGFGKGGFGFQNSSYIVVEGLEFCWLAGAPTLGYCNDITIRNCVFHDLSHSAIKTWFSSRITLENLTIHKIYLSHGIYLSSETSDVIIRNCTIFDTEINGIHVNESGIRNILIERNRLFNLSHDWGAVITLFGPKNVTIRNNLIYANDGHIFTVTAKPVKKGENVEDGWTRNVTIVNNTVYQLENGRKGALFVVDGCLDGFTVKNNIFKMNTAAFQVQDKSYFKPNCDFNQNVWSRASGKQIQDFYPESKNIFDADIVFASPPADKSGSGDLHLKKESAGAEGFSVLKELAPTDFDEKNRSDNGSAGAFATISN